MTTTFKGKTLSQVKKEALQIIQAERSNQQLGLFTRYSKLNVAIGKYMRFGQVTCLAGASGHGKTFFLNMLINDFLSSKLNRDCVHDFIIPYHSFEMLPADDIIRTLSSKTGKSYHNLLSSEYNGGSYNAVTDSEFEYYKSILEDEKEEPPLYYYEVPCTVSQIKRNIKEAIAYHQEIKGTLNKPRVVLPIDHTLLIEQDENEGTILDTMSFLGKASIELKKDGHMIIFLGQLNNNIESTERIRNSELHYPMKSDIYAQAQIFNACDNVWTLHRPELLNILNYGHFKLPTSKLVHFQIVKSRFGSVGSIWLENRLHEGKFVPFINIDRLIKEKLNV